METYELDTLKVAVSWMRRHIMFDAFHIYDDEMAVIKKYIDKKYYTSLFVSSRVYRLTISPVVLDTIDLWLIQPSDHTLGEFIEMVVGIE